MSLVLNLFFHCFSFHYLLLFFHLLELGRSVELSSVASSLTYSIVAVWWKIPFHFNCCTQMMLMMMMAMMIVCTQQQHSNYCIWKTYTDSLPTQIQTNRLSTIVCLYCLAVVPVVVINIVCYLCACIQLLGMRACGRYGAIAIYDWNLKLDLPVRMRVSYIRTRSYSCKNYKAWLKPYSRSVYMSVCIWLDNVKNMELR